MKTMNKEANFLNNYVNSHTPLEILGQTALLGAGGFSAGKLLQEVLRNMNHKKTKDPNTLEVPVPASFAKEGTEKELSSLEKKAVLDTVLKVLALVGGPTAGVLGTKALYDLAKKQEGKMEIGHAEKQRLKLMEQLKQGSEKSETPCVDAFCEKIAEILEEKYANEDPRSILQQARDFGWGMAHPSEVSEHANPVDSFSASKFYNTLTGGTGDLLNTAMLLTAGVGGGYALNKLMKERKEKAEAKSKRYPTTVAINPTEA